MATDAMMGGASPSGTAGFSPSFLSALASLQNLPSSDPYSVGPGAPDSSLAALMSQNPGGYVYMGRSNLSGQQLDPQAFLPSASPSGLLSQGQGGPNSGAPNVAAAAPSLSDVLNAILGTAPSAPTAANFGPAPTLSDFFSSAPYQQAQAQLQTGNKAAQSTINNTYQQALKQAATTDQQANAATAQNTAAANQDMANATSAINGYAQQAQQMGGAGGQLGARMAGLQATSAQQQAGEKALDSQLAGIQNGNMSQDKAMLTTGQQAALNFLASQVAGQSSKIGLAQSSDQARAQQMLGAALNTYGRDQSTAQNQYASEMAKYNTAKTGLIAKAEKAISGNATGALGGKDWASGQLAQWSQNAAQGDQNASVLAQAANSLLAPVKTSPTSNGSTPSYQQALQRLSANAGALGGSNGIAYNALNNWLQNFYGVSKVGLGNNSPQVEQQALSQWLLQNYLGG